VLNGLDLFSGIGGLSLALDGLVRPVAYCESDRYAQAVLLSRMFDRRLGVAPIWDDVRTLRGSDIPTIDIIYGGFPCQDISCAGLGRGLVGEPSGLYWQIERLVKETKPRFIFLENVPAIRTRGLNSVVQSLTEFGYDCRWTLVSAQELGAPHIRKRWFLLAHANGLRLREEQWTKQSTSERPLQPNDDGPSQFMADNDSFRELQPKGREQKQRGRASDRSWWEVEPDVGRVADGVLFRVDRLRGLGNSVVPLQAQTAFKRLCGLE
jgi:DNA (cytosine-5)-methyltransferase 1